MIKINRNEDFSNEKLLDNYYYEINVDYTIDTDSDNINFNLEYEEYTHIIKTEKIIKSYEDDDTINMEYYTKDKSNLKSAEENMLKIIYEKIDKFIQKHLDEITDYRDLLKKSNYYREKKLKRVLKE